MSLFILTALLTLYPLPPEVPVVGPPNDVHEGVVVLVGSGAITIRDKAGENESFLVQPETKITYNGKSGALDLIQEGDTAQITARKMGSKLLAVTIDARSRM